MITCFTCADDGRFFDLDEICNMDMMAQWDAAIGLCPVCGSSSTEM